MRKINTPVTIALIGINCICFLITSGFQLSVWNLFGNGAFIFSEPKNYYRLVTALFCHGSLSHLGSNMIALYGVGIYLENALGKKRFLLFYFLCGIFGGLLSDFLLLFRNSIPFFEDNVYSVSIGASGAIFGLVGIFIVMSRKGWFEQIPLRRILAFMVLSLVDGATEKQVDLLGHITGFAVGVVLALIFLKKNGSKNVLPVDNDTNNFTETE